MRPIVNKFDDPTKFEGWNCDKITKCGKYGEICGGVNTKAKGHIIEKIFTLPANRRKFAITMDFIKIDSWFAKRAV